VISIFLLSFFLSSPNLSGRRLDVYHMSTTWCGLSANLECRSETCCMRLAENTGCKKVTINRHLGTIAQFCRAICSQLRHILTIGKKLVKQQYVVHWMSTILPQIHTWCGLSANLGCRSETCCMRLDENTGHKNVKNDAKKLPSGHHRTTLSGCIWMIPVKLVPKAIHGRWMELC